MQNLNFSITIHAPIATVWTTMLDHPTYEEWTTAFCPGSTYKGSWDQGSEIQFHGPEGHGYMLATIAEHTLHAYISIKHLGEVGEDSVMKSFDHESFENYRFTKIDENTTQLDIELIGMPDERVDMFNDMRPKALDLLKELCE